jgi:hypothetical protein
MGLVVSRLDSREKACFSRLSTGSQFLGRESNSHYHLHMKCLSTVCPSIHGSQPEIPDSVKVKLNLTQLMYLYSCFRIQL